MSKFHLNAREREMLYRLGQAAIPPGRIFPPFSRDVVDRIEGFLADNSRTVRRTFLALLYIIEEGARLRYLRPLSKLSHEKARKYLEFWADATATMRLPFRLVTVIVKAFYYDNPGIFEQLQMEYRKPPVKDEPARWQRQVLCGRDVHEDLNLEAEVVVVGTGAGGAVVAAELAEKGNAVVMIEEGEYHPRSDFSGRPFEMQKLLYRNSGFIATAGNTTIILPVGRCVGGTTTINSGTCFATPNRELRRWRENFGLTDFTPAHMKPYFDRVFNVYQVTTADMKYVGKNGEVVARGAEKLGYSHGPLPRNAPDCDGQGVCAFGCPTDAKRSTNVSYVPRACEASAYLVTGTEVDKVIVQNGEVKGVQGRCLKTGKSVTVKAPIVVLACGSLYTPLLLMKNRLGGRSGQLGRNLSIHPASPHSAIMDERIDGWKSIPQGYMVDEFKSEGLVLEGAQVPLDLTASFYLGIGQKLQDFMEQYDHFATFGFMIKDTSRGTVRPSGTNMPFIAYYLNKHDRRRIIQGHEILARIYLAAGAQITYAPIHGWIPMRDEADLKRNLSRTVNAWDIDLSAYHPLGTARMGGDPDGYVASPYGELYDQPNLFIADGSVVPPAIGVNPMITISALATRTADYIDERLKTLSHV